MMNYRVLPLVLICLLAVSGCVQTRVYLAERERVDQKVPGIPPPEKPKTRQVLVLEVIEKGPSTTAAVSGSGKGQDKGQSKVVTGANDTVIVHESNFTFPKMSSETLTQGVTVDADALVVPAQYKVEKDDTLQKISKKLYGTFSKWTRIYDANREVIKDPNFLKPGIMLKIPSGE